MSKESLTAELLNLVSQRTGYPKEMLGLNLDLEAELGIDSIKRVEILATLAESCGISATGANAAAGAPKIELEILTGIKTLSGIIDYFEKVLSTDATATAPEEIVHPSANGHAKSPKPLIAHAGTNGVLLCHLLGLEPVPWEWDRFVTGHASITRLVSIELGDGHTFSLTKLSDVEHLDVEDRTH